MPLTIGLSFAQPPSGQLVIVYGVQTDAPLVFPTIWQLGSSLMRKTNLSIPWTDGMQAYYSDASCTAGATVANVTVAPCTLGQTCRLDADQNLETLATGPQDQLSLLNANASGWTFGCCLDTGNGAAPHFACALGPGNLVQAIPGPSLLLYFVTSRTRAGEMVGPTPYRAAQAAIPFSPILCLDMAQLAGLPRPTQPGQPLVTVGYDAGTGGWKPPQPTPSWASVHDATSDIPTLAIQPLPGG